MTVEGSSGRDVSKESYCEYHTHVAYQRSSRALAAHAAVKSEASQSGEAVADNVKPLKPRAAKISSGR